MTSLEEQVGGSQNVLGGPFGSKLTQKDYTEEGVPIIRGSNMVTDGRWLGGEFAFVSEAKVEADLKHNLAQPGDIIVTQRGTLGQVAIVPYRHGFDQYVISQSQMAVRVPKHKAHRDFVFYLLRSQQFAAYVETSTIQTGVPHINLGILRSAPAIWPEREQQKQIASALAVLDDKIDLNRRMNETLEAMARAIFKDWFVDFGPTRAKAEGRAPYLAPELWELFPDALDDEGKPAGWSIYSLSDLAQHHRATLSPGAQPERTYEHYSIPAYDAGNEPATGLGGSIKSNKTIVPDGAVLLSKLNPEIERVWLPNPNGEAPQVASTEFLALTPLAPATRSVLYSLFKSPNFRAEMAAGVTGTSKSHQPVPPKSLLASEVLAANPRLLALFDGKVNPMMCRLLSNRRESRELAQTRDLLLPKLMSGEIRLRDAEEVVEAAA